MDVAGGVQFFELLRDRESVSEYISFAELISTVQALQADIVEVDEKGMSAFVLEDVVHARKTRLGLLLKVKERGCLSHHIFE